MSPSQIWNQFLDHNADRGAEYIEQDEQRGVLGNFSLVDSYIRKELHFVVRLRDRQGAEYLACLESCRAAGDRGKSEIRQLTAGMLLGPIRTQLRLALWRKSVAIGMASYREQKTVLVDNVQAVEHPQGFIPSLVWMDAADRLYSVLPHALYASRESGFKLFGGFENWETGVSVRSLPRGLNDSADKMIKRASQIEKSVTQNQCKFKGQLGNVIHQDIDVPKFAVILARDGYGVGLSESVPSGLQITDVLLGPLELG